MLDGIRILDLSRLLPGPASTWFLASQGAKVDRIEPKKGDLTRHIPPKVSGEGAYFAATSWGKRSMCIDFYHERANSLIHRLLPNYDVLVEGFRPGVMEAMQLDPNELQKRYPKLIIARLSGYGQTGSYARRAGHDINYIAEIGILSAMRRDEHGHSLPSVQIADMACALQAAFQISSALYARSQSGTGCILDVSLTASALSMFAPMLTGLMAEGRSAKAGGEWLTGGWACYGSYLCGDGKYIAVGAVEAKFQSKIYERAGGSSRADLAKMFVTKPQAYWVEVFNDACVSAVHEGKDIWSSPWITEQGYISGDQIRAASGRFLEEPPSLGADNEAILRDAGCDDCELATWLESGVLHQ